MLEILSQELQSILPDASLQACELPACEGLSLYLINPEYSLDALDEASVKKVMENPLYWMFCWASGKAMAQLIMQKPEMVKGKVVMDVGSGSGVVAIAAMLAGAKKVIASDIDQMSHLAISLNAQLNNVDIDIIGNYSDYSGEVDLITLADVLYDSSNIPLLEDLIERAPQVLLADSRVKNFTHPGLTWVKAIPGETFPALGGFDEFFEVNIFQSVSDKV